MQIAIRVKGFPENKDEKRMWRKQGFKRFSSHVYFTIISFLQNLL